MRAKKSLAMLLALMMVLIFGLTACSPSASPTGSAAPSAAAPEATPDDVDGGSAEGSAPPAEIGDRKSVLVWAQIFEDWNNKYTEDMVARFNTENKDYYIDLQFVPGDAWDEKLTASQAAGTAPDAYMVNYNKILHAASQGMLMPLNDYISAEAFDDLHDNIKEMVSYDGKYYAYPWLVEPSMVLYYNKEMFTAAGLDPNKPPTTWAELVEYGKKLTNGDTFGLGVPGNAVELSWSTWGMQIGASGHRPITDDWSAANVQEQGYVDFINLFKTLYDEGIVPAQALSGYSAMQPFADGGLAMTIAGSWAIPSLYNDYPEMVEKTGVAVMPTRDGNQKVTTATLGGWTYVIDAKARQPEGAGTFIEWMLGGDPSIPGDFFKLAQFSKYPVRKGVDAYLAADADAASNEWLKTISEGIVPYAVAEPIYAWDISFAVGSAVESAVIDGKTAEEVLQTAADTINTYIADNNYAGTNPQK